MTNYYLKQPLWFTGDFLMTIIFIQKGILLV